MEELYFCGLYLDCVENKCVFDGMLNKILL